LVIALLAVSGVQYAKGEDVVSFCIERSGTIAPDNAIGKEGRISDPCYASKECDNGKQGGEPRILQCPLEEGKDGNREVGDEELRKNEDT
jgi:hypothetical protein